MQALGSNENDTHTQQSQEETTSNEKLIISYSMDGIYLWKLESQKEEYSDEVKSQMFTIIKEFIFDFFKISRGEIDEVIELSLDFHETLKKFFLNIRINSFEFVENVLFEYSSFNDKIIDLKREIGKEILSIVEKSFPFKKVVKKLIVQDLDFKYEANVFLTKVIQMKTLVFPDLFELFLYSFKPFIKNFSSQIESSIQKFVEKSIIEFNTKFEKCLLLAKERLESYLLEIVMSIQPMRVKVFMREAVDCSVLGPWIICFHKLFEYEKVELKQVLHLSPTSSLITIAFHKSNNFLSVFNNQHIITISDSIINDSETIICEGSTSQSLILIHNMLRTAYIVVENKGKFEPVNSIDIFNGDIGKITSAAVLRTTREIAFIDDGGAFRFHSFAKNKKSEVIRNQIIPCLYKQVNLSPCGNFILLVATNEFYVFNSNFEIIIQYEVVSDLICLTRNSIIIIQNPHVEETLIITKTINSDYLSGIDITTSIIDKANNSLRATYSIGKELIKGEIKKKRFGKVKFPDTVL